MGLKKSSEPIQISSSMPLSVIQDTASSNTRTISLQLNPLDNEVFVVTAVKIDFEQLPNPDPTRSLQGGAHLQCSILKTAPAGGAIQSIGNTNCVASTRLNLYMQTAIGPPYNVLQYVVQENGPMDTPPANQDYLDIIATDNYVIQFSSSNALDAQEINAVVRVYGYRAKADAATYAALVQSEVISA
jgi:hypothetical protein